MDKLIFGTDGWRDIIGDTYTFANVARVAQAYADYLKDEGQSRVVVGYDTRFNGELFAERVAQVLAANGLSVLLSKSYLPTPALSFAVKHYEAGGGVMLTASHNPPAYHGFKLKGAYGGTATAIIYEAVSRRVDAISTDDVAVFDEVRHSVERFDIRKAYFGALSELVDVEALRSFTGTLVHDAMGGSAATWLAGFFKYAKLKNITLHEIHAVPNPTFYGVNPEPLPHNLGSTIAVMRDSDAVFATATDGDGDRLGLVLPGGAFFNSHQIFAVLLDVLYQKGVRGKVVKTFTVSRLVERLAEKRGLELSETPVGFKHIVDAMLREEVLVGGEESGGIGVAGHIPERDGIANSLLLLEAVVTSGQSLAERFAALEREADWRHAYDRLDLKLSGNALKDAVLGSLDDPPETFAERDVTSTETRDGVKLNLSGNAWLLFRASGTEPLLRVYCEAPSDDEVKDILAAAQAFVEAQT
ncbi:MAG: phosphoglucomutase/phosphomannomutase family protein [Trueperaceae bacterium]|nr:phosphoglucomutase/phosphomannomutase family protein [Trueperaceae bacterium]